MTNSPDAIIPPRPGRIPDPYDERDADYPMRSMLPPLEEARRTRRPSHGWDYNFEPLSQGSTGTCVGHACEAFILTEPVVRKGRGEPPDAFAIYNLCTQIDEFPANDDRTGRHEGAQAARLHRGLAQRREHRRRDRLA
jgi:hypothetical protein